MNAAEVKRLVQPGKVFDLTNHYIDRPDHPCFGTRRVTIERVTGSSFYLAGQQWPIKWPKAFQIDFEDGEIRLYGCGAGQAPGELTLSLREVVA